MVKRKTLNASHVEDIHFQKLNYCVETSMKLIK